MRIVELSMWTILRSVFTVAWAFLMGIIAIVDWGKDNLWQTLIYDRSGVMHEMVYMAAFGIGVIWLSTKVERWFK